MLPKEAQFLICFLIGNCYQGKVSLTFSSQVLFASSIRKYSSCVPENYSPASRYTRIYYLAGSGLNQWFPDTWMRAAPCSLGSTWCTCWMSVSTVPFPTRQAEYRGGLCTVSQLLAISNSPGPDPAHATAQRLVLCEDANIVCYISRRWIGDRQGQHIKPQNNPE